MRGCLLALASCSFAAVRGPAPPPQPPGDCTTSRAAPAVDRLGELAGSLGIVLGVAFLVGASACSSSHPPGYNADSCTAEGGFGVLVGLPSAVAAITYAISAHYGNSRIDACRARRAEPPPAPAPPDD
ncbi:MAG: hypothetical protein ACM31C_25280 [Acidobacteriota bacterium]